MRAPVPAVLVALAVAALGAVMLGEHDLAGVRPLIAGVVFGITIGEVIASVSRSGEVDGPLLGAAALVAEAGLVWATWISTGHHLELAAPSAWAGILAGSAAAPFWLKSAGRRGAHNPDGPAPTPAG